MCEASSEGDIMVKQLTWELGGNLSVEDGHWFLYIVHNYHLRLGAGEIGNNGLPTPVTDEQGVITI